MILQLDEKCKNLEKKESEKIKKLEEKCNAFVKDCERIKKFEENCILLEKKCEVLSNEKMELIKIFEEKEKKFIEELEFLKRDYQEKINQQNDFIANIGKEKNVFFKIFFVNSFERKSSKISQNKQKF